MASPKGKGERIAPHGNENEPRVEFEDDLDALFKLPSTEFTAARNALAARLKKAGSRDASARVKALAKPPISAWAVNQVYWKHKDAFDELIAVGERLSAAHASQLAGKPADTRALLTARRETLSNLARLAAELLQDAGHTPTPETMRRITTTLEALSTYALISDAPPLGRLTDDIDPPGFESLAALIPSAGRVERPQAPSSARSGDIDGREEHLQTRIASAEAALQAAELVLRERRTVVQDAAAAAKEAAARANEKEKERREAEQHLAKASAAAEEASQRLRILTEEAERAKEAFEEAERDVEKARKELEEQNERIRH